MQILYFWEIILKVALAVNMADNWSKTYSLVMSTFWPKLHDIFFRDEFLNRSSLAETWNSLQLIDIHKCDFSIKIKQGKGKGGELVDIDNFQSTFLLEQGQFTKLFHFYFFIYSRKLVPLSSHRWLQSNSTYTKRKSNF